VHTHLAVSSFEENKQRIAVRYSPRCKRTTEVLNCRQKNKNCWGSSNNSLRQSLSRCSCSLCRGCRATIRGQLCILPSRTRGMDHHQHPSNRHCIHMIRGQISSIPTKNQLDTVHIQALRVQGLDRIVDCTGPQDRVEGSMAQEANPHTMFRTCNQSGSHSQLEQTKTVGTRYMLHLRCLHKSLLDTKCNHYCPSLA
jgi:hypothetical protein